MVGLVAAAPLLLMVKHFMSAGDALDKMSARVRLSVETLSALDYAAQCSGTSLDSLAQALFRSQRRIGNAVTATGPAVRALKELGLSAAELDAMTPEDQFFALVDALDKVPSKARASQMAFEIFGDNWRQLAPLLTKGSDGIRELMEEAQKLGIVMGPEQTKAAAVLTDAWLRVKTALKMAGVQIGSALAPMLTKLAAQVTALLGPMIDWIKQNTGLFVSIGKLVAGTVATGAALMALGGLLWSVGTILGTLAVAVLLAVTGLGALLGVIAAIASPIGLAIIAIVGLGTYLMHVTGTGQKAIDGLAQVFGHLKDVAVETFAGIADALRSGDLKLAATILWTSLKLVWAEGMNWIVKMWDKMVTKISNIWRKFSVSFFTEALADWLAPMFADWYGATYHETRKQLRQMMAQDRKALARDTAPAFIDNPEIARLKAELKSLTSRARQQARAARDWKPDYAGGDEGPDGADWGDLKRSIRGTFSGFAVAGMGTGSWQGKLVKAAEDGNKKQAEVKQTLEEIQAYLKLVLQFAP